MQLRKAGELRVMSAYLLWGVLPLFWKLFSTVPPSKVLFHRTLWAAVWLALALGYQGQLRPTIRRAVRDSRALAAAGVAALLLATNWFTYLIAIFRHELQEASLGYYICPLFTIALGWLILGERLSVTQRGALMTVATGVLLKVLAQGALPWYALILAVSFSLYSLVRKSQGWGPEAGLFIETVLLVPLVAAVMVVMAGTEATLFVGSSPAEFLLLAAAGLVTAVPLVLLVGGAKHCSLQFVGAAQYITPTVSLITSWLAFDEPLPASDLVSFAVVWLGIALLVSEPWLMRIREGAAEVARKRALLFTK